MAYTVVVWANEVNEAGQYACNGIFGSLKTIDVARKKAMTELKKTNGRFMCLVYDDKAYKTDKWVVGKVIDGRGYGYGEGFIFKPLTHNERYNYPYYVINKDGSLGVGRRWF